MTVFLLPSAILILKIPMSAQIDPDENEIRYLLAACPPAGKRILEIGCGAGILTWKYAPLAKSVTAIDPNEDGLREAIRNTPANAERVHFVRAFAEYLPFDWAAFDAVFYTSSF